MNNKIQAKDQSQLKKKAITLLSKAIAKIVLKFKLPRNELLISLDKMLILEAKKQDPGVSNVALATRTGIDRRYVTKHLNGEMPRARPDKLTMILEDIHWTAHKFYNSKKIPKFGHFRTFQSICQQRASGSLTPNAILEELIRSGNIKDLGSKIELLKLRSETIQNDIDYSTLTAVQINRVVSTIIDNCDTEQPLDKYVQRTVFSTKINPTEFSSLHNDINLKTESFWDEIATLMTSYEENVDIGTYPEYGYSFLEYKLEE